MKIRIKGDTIRLRLSRTELTQLEAKGKVEEICHLSPTSHFKYSLVKKEGIQHMEASFLPHGIQINLPTAMASGLQVPEKVGFKDSVDNGINGLNITVEKDWQCLKPRPE